jgi:hypothetical protein
VLTTFFSYGEVGNQRQGEIIQTLGESRTPVSSEVIELAKALAKQILHADPKMNRSEN